MLSICGQDIFSVDILPDIADDKSIEQRYMSTVYINSNDVVGMTSLSKRISRLAYIRFPSSPLSRLDVAWQRVRWLGSNLIAHGDVVGDVVFGIG